MRYFAGFGEKERNLHSIYCSYLIKLLLTISLESHSRFLSFLTSRIEEPLLMYQFHLLHIFDIMVRFLQRLLHLINNIQSICRNIMSIIQQLEDLVISF